MSNLSKRKRNSKADFILNNVAKIDFIERIRKINKIIDELSSKQEGKE